MRRQPGPHSGYSPGRPGAEGPAKLSLDCWCTEPGRKGMRITKSAVVCRKQAQPPLLRVHHLEIAPELRCLASQVSLLCRRPSSSELQRGRQKALLSVTSCQKQAFSPRRKLQARRRDWNNTQHAARFATAPENHRLYLWKDVQVSSSVLYLYPWGSEWLLKELQVEPVFWHPHEHSQHCLNIYWVKQALSHPWTTIILRGWDG